MELYKKEGVNPMGGCLPMLIQLPILYAFYKVLNVTIELRGAHWLWVTDLSQPEKLPIHILPLIMIVSQFVMQKMTPNPGMDPSQAKMMMFMPLMFGFFFYNFSSGLVLYWLTSNLVGIVQQWMVNRTMPAPPRLRRRKIAGQEKNQGIRPVGEKKYTVASTGPRIEEFLDIVARRHGPGCRVRNPGRRAHASRSRRSRYSGEILRARTWTCCWPIKPRCCWRSNF